MSVVINFWAVVVSMVVSVVLGFIWYGPLFGKKWAALSGLTIPAEKPPFKTMIKPIVLSLLGALFANVILSMGVHGATVATGMLAGFFAWLGFVVPVYLNFSGWEGKPWTLFSINAGYWLVYLLVAGSILAAWA